MRRILIAAALCFLGCAIGPPTRSIERVRFKSSVREIPWYASQQVLNVSTDSNSYYPIWLQDASTLRLPEDLVYVPVICDGDWYHGDIPIVDDSGKETDVLHAVGIGLFLKPLSSAEDNRRLIFRPDLPFHTIGFLPKHHDPNIRWQSDHVYFFGFEDRPQKRQSIRKFEDIEELYLDCQAIVEFRSEKRPANQPPLQTPASGTPAAGAPVAPPPSAAGR